MRILITRPRDDAEDLAHTLVSLGHEPLIEPMLNIRLGTAPRLDIDGAQALLFTSANGVRAAAKATRNRALPALCVGDATARAAKIARFETIKSANGDVPALVTLVQKQCKPSSGKLIHVAGTAIAGDLAGSLAALGYETERAVLYEAETVTTLSPAARQALAQGTIDAVLLFSPRTARTFAKVVRDAGIEPACKMIDLLCLSTAVAEGLGGLSHRTLQIADEPTQDALLRLIP
ncbi:MAG: uroporphyrinogen-III synthase [Alphaproteobacteria bacterium]